MPYGLYISAEGAQAQNARLETIANNLANVDTTGFKRDLALFQARYAEAVEQGSDYYGSGSVNDMGGGVMPYTSKTDFSPGPLEQTGIDTDMAVHGDGFFMVRKDGENFLTRSGDFQLTPTGDLLTAEGYPVLSDTGTPVSIDPQGGAWELSAAGAISQAGSVTPLALVKPGSLGDLAKAGENLFRPLGPVQPVDPLQRRVAWKYLERSGVQPTTAMMEMIEASRGFEANINMIRNQDQMLGALVSRVLKTA